MLTPSKIAEIQTIVELITDKPVTAEKVTTVYEKKMLAILNPVEGKRQKDEDSKRWHQGVEKALNRL